eukprot:Gb_04340 [translate_table: standard]
MGSNSPLYNEDKLRVTPMSTSGNVDKQEDQPYHPEPCDLIFSHDRGAGALGAESPQITGRDEKPISSKREILGMHLETQNVEFVRPDFNRHGVVVLINSLATSHHILRKFAARQFCYASGLLYGVLLLSTHGKNGNGDIKPKTTDSRNDRGGIITRTVQSDRKKARLSADSDITKQECEGAVVVGKSSMTEGSKRSHS